MPISIGPSEIGPIAAVRAVRTQPFAATPERFPPVPPESPGTPEPAVQIEAAALAAAPPVDSDRVAQIRSALAEGSYPLVPARIADAMIAAGLRLSLGE